jgi:uncharacterized membrane protein
MLAALAFAPFAIPVTAFWIYVCASLLFLVGLIKIVPEVPRERGIDKIMPFGRMFFAIPLAVFASEHFTITPTIAALVPRWIPAHVFWTYLVGTGFFCAAISITVLVQARLAATLVGMTFFMFVLTMDLPAAAVANPHNRFFWALAARELAFSGGALALALNPMLAKAPRMGHATSWMVIPRWFLGIPALFYGLMHLLHPAYVPGIPLNKLTPEWIPGRIALSYWVGVVLIAAGACLIVNKKTRMAATLLALTILLTLLWIYLPMLLAAPTTLLALNFFFDTLLFCGAILLVGNATEKGRRARDEGRGHSAAHSR